MAILVTVLWKMKVPRIALIAVDSIADCIVDFDHLGLQYGQQQYHRFSSRMVKKKPLSFLSGP